MKMTDKQGWLKQKTTDGQSSIEMAVLLIVVMGALLTAQMYFKRGIQGRWKTAVDEMSDELYDPFSADSDVTYSTAANSVVTIVTMEDVSGTVTIRTDQTNSLDARSGIKRIGGY